MSILNHLFKSAEGLFNQPPCPAVIQLNKHIMSDPKERPLTQNPGSDPKIDATEQDVVTNSDESAKVVNQDGTVEHIDGMEETLTQSEPTTCVAADSEAITNDESDVITNSDAANDITPEN